MRWEGGLEKYCLLDHSLFAWEWKWVCVCVRERERKIKREGERKREREREREKERERKREDFYLDRKSPWMVAKITRWQFLRKIIFFVCGNYSFYKKTSQLQGSIFWMLRWKSKYLKIFQYKTFLQEKAAKIRRMSKQSNFNFKKLTQLSKLKVVLFKVS